MYSKIINLIEMFSESKLKTRFAVADYWKDCPTEHKR